MAGTWEAVGAMLAALDAAGVPATADARAQFPASAGYVLCGPPDTLVPGVARDESWLMSGALWAIASGPWDTAAWRVLDVLVARAVLALGDYLDSITYAPEVVQMMAAGVDAPAVQLHYSAWPMTYTAPAPEVSTL